MSRSAADPLELWGGIECTVNRVGDRYADQVVLTGHQNRIDDLDRFAALGLAAIRYPVLWERVAPDRPDACDWHWSDERLARLRLLRLRPIVGLLHHGSGPRYTDLLDPGFAEGLGRFAAQAAARYDWVQDWTPVNEPLTTARFSALYGHWYPHAKDERLFWLALLNQVAGVRAAMKAIRRVRADARLIQTDDFGHSYSTPPLADQARFDNERRWAAWDLLFGRLTRDHPLWERLCGFGFGDRLREAADDPCPPDIVGLNHYLTSDRFLDHRIGRYPPDTHGGNGRDTFADVEAVRVVDPLPCGLTRAIQAVWARYRVPLALTEVHVGCTRDEQLRFAAEVWDTAVAARAAGVDVVAVTAWSLLGSSGWNTLLTSPGIYEPGLFDTSDGEPRPTALRALWGGLRSDHDRHPVTRSPGWWRRDIRLLYDPVAIDGERPLPPASFEPRPLLILVADGPLKNAFACVGMLRGLTVEFGSPPNSSERKTEMRELAVSDPWAVIEIHKAEGVGFAGESLLGAIESARSDRAPTLIQISAPPAAVSPEVISRFVGDVLDLAIDKSAANTGWSASQLGKAHMTSTDYRDVAMLRLTEIEA